MQRNFIAIAVVFGSKEEPNDNSAGNIALYMQTNLEDFVVQLGALNKDGDIVIQPVT